MKLFMRLLRMQCRNRTSYGIVNLEIPAQDYMNKMRGEREKENKYGDLTHIEKEKAHVV